MTSEIKLCKDCSRFIHMNEQCGRSGGIPDYVHGRPPQTVRAQDERVWDTKDNCGPSAKFFAPIVPADYAETMIRKDKEKRHVGCSEDDMDIACRKLQAGS